MNESVLPFRLHQIIGQRPGPHGLIVGGVHGDEWEPMAAVHRLQKELVSVDVQGQVSLVTVANEEAFWLRSRTGSDAKDLARTCPGCEDGSLTERIAFHLSALIREADFLIDLHTGGVAMRLLPLAGFMADADEKLRSKQRDMARAFGLPVVWGSGWAPGRTLSVAAEAGVPAIYTEYGGGAPMQAAGVKAYVSGVKNVLALWSMLDGTPSLAPARWEQEDTRENSGNLMAAHPAPCSGFWEAGVELGDVVRRGDVIGHVWSLDGAQEAEIPAESDGVVLCLRAVAPVQQGESLATLLGVPV
jgi:predicted deacylase